MLTTLKVNCNPSSSQLRIAAIDQIVIDSCWISLTGKTPKGPVFSSDGDCVTRRHRGDERADTRKTEVDNENIREKERESCDEVKVKSTVRKICAALESKMSRKKMRRTARDQLFIPSYRRKKGRRIFSFRADGQMCG